MNKEIDIIRKNISSSDFGDVTNKVTHFHTNGSVFTKIVRITIVLGNEVLRLILVELKILLGQLEKLGRELHEEER